MATNSPTYDIKTFLGIRNVGESRRLPLGALESATNVYLDDEGAILSRKGITEITTVTFTDVTAAHEPVRQDFSYVVDNGVLYRIESGPTKYAIGNVSTNETYWADVANKTYLSTGYIVEGDTLISWPVQPPSDLLVRASQGNLRAGRYLVTATQTTADGRESVTCNVVEMILTDGSGIYIENAAGKNIYMTECDGEVFYFVGNGINNIESTEQLSEALADDLLLNSTLPDGVSVIAYYDAAMHVAVFDQVKDQTIIYRSKPYRHHVFDVTEDYFTVPGEVRAMVSDSGLANLTIATDRTIYAHDGQALTKLANYGVPKGTTARIGKNGYALIWTNRGMCEVEPFKNLTQDKVSLPSGSSCVTAITEHDGVEQFIVLTDGAGTANNKVTL